MPNPNQDRNKTPPHNALRAEPSLQPRLEGLAREYFTQSKAKAPEIISSHMEAKISSFIAAFTKDLPLTTATSSAPEPSEVRVGNVIGQIAGLVFADLFSTTENSNPDHLIEVAKRAYDLFLHLRGLDEMTKRAFAETITPHLKSGEIEKIFEAEVSYEAIAKLAAFALCSTHSPCWSVMSLRDDIGDLVSGRTMNPQSVQFDLQFAWFSHDFDMTSHEQLASLIEVVANEKALRTGVPQIISASDIDELASHPQYVEALKGCSIIMYPLMYGRDYLGALYSVVPTGERVVPHIEKDGKLLAHATASALARVARILGSQGY
jgi:hypothetical protein